MSTSCIWLVAYYLSLASLAFSTLLVFGVIHQIMSAVKTQELLVIREPVKTIPGKESCTLGKLYRNGVCFSETCEDEDRYLEKGNGKVYGRTAIPRGRYRVIVTMSQRFGKRLPLLVGTEPLFSGIRIHGANRAEDLLGCIGVGQVRTSDGIAQCADTVKRIIDMIDKATEQAIETWIEVK